MLRRKKLAKSRNHAVARAAAQGAILPLDSGPRSATPMGVLPQWLIIATGSILILFSVFCFGAGVWRHLSLPETRFARIDDGAHQGSSVQQHLRTARSRVCRARPSGAKHEFVRHYNRRRISLEFVEGALR
jgi:hypothetical protein